ncbi:hypothetical protein BT96DRAFT_1017738 [Gymnopus androsaceus JB14]|uniref:F-box domain-containing protein n=1 Tax=Gymnopus androsaceus JB14 TaxID=1447944 RepID=A0A6A4HVE2_9AGAR|nr:hypothetical protein BT96DRAFT_1017738 [Gymnopus androsaceus JB14]
MISSSRSALIFTHSVISPAQHLPFDVLSEIFKYLPDLELAEEAESEVISPKTGPYILRPAKYPWYLTRICSAWRYAALYEARLWSRVHVEVGHRSPSPGKVELLREYLSRSRNQPLFVSIHCTWVGGAEENALLSVLFPTSNRWVFFSLHVLSKCLSTFHALADSFPNLETLHLYVAHQGPRTGTTDVHEIFHNAPRLHTVRFRNSEDRSIFPMPLDQLRVYHGPTSSIPPESGYEWISNLRWCSFAANRRQTDWILDPNAKVTAPYMRELSIQERILSVNTVAIFKMLTLPNLEILRIESTDRARLCPAITSLLHRSACILTELCLDIPDLDLDMTTVLEDTPQVTKLRLTAKKVLSSFFSPWTYNPETHMEAPCLLQYLEHLDLGRCTFTPHAEITLMQAIRSRWQVPQTSTLSADKYFGGPSVHSVVRLRSFQVPYKFQRTKRSQKKDLKVWKAEGLDIQFGPGSLNRL